MLSDLELVTMPASRGLLLLFYFMLCFLNSLNDKEFTIEVNNLRGLFRGISFSLSLSKTI